MAKNMNISRTNVYASYLAAEAGNAARYSEGDPSATAEYIYANQREDAAAIIHEFYANRRRVISVIKKTKIGLDGLMVELAKLMTTHPDDNFAVYYKDVRILTGMANIKWQTDMRLKAPACFSSNVYHHGQLGHSDLANMCNALIIIDEIDTGDKEYQKLHTTLHTAGLLDVGHMTRHNNRFVFASATMFRELYDLYRWGDLHAIYRMTIPAEYIGHADFLARDILREFYPMQTAAQMAKWLQEDVVDTYGDDFRIHIARLAEKYTGVMSAECARRGIACRIHNSLDELPAEEMRAIFETAPTAHTVICIKGFYRRATLIPNAWKLRIGATHERYTSIIDNNVQIQGLPGRMTGYWRSQLDAGHKTGPHRTSVLAVLQYEQAYRDPFGCVAYHTSGFTKKNGRVSAKTPTMISPHHIAGLVPVPVPDTAEPAFASRYRISPLFDTRVELRAYLKSHARSALCVAIGQLLAGNTIRWNGQTRPIPVYESAEQFAAIAYSGGIGRNTSARGVPVMCDGVVKWIGIYDPIVLPPS